MFVSLALTTGSALAQGCGDRAQAIEPRSTFEARADFSSDPVPQIQAHLSAVVSWRLARDVWELLTDRRRERGERIADLVLCMERGAFPLNDVRPYPTPVFIDSGGRACALGYLMIASGA